MLSACQSTAETEKRQRRVEDFIFFLCKKLINKNINTFPTSIRIMHSHFFRATTTTPRPCFHQPSFFFSFFLLWPLKQGEICAAFPLWQEEVMAAESNLACPGLSDRYWRTASQVSYSAELPTSRDREKREPVTVDSVWIDQRDYQQSDLTTNRTLFF